MVNRTKKPAKLKAPKALAPIVDGFGPRTFWINPFDKDDPESPWHLCDPDAELEDGCLGALLYEGKSTPLLIGRVDIKKVGKTKQVYIGEFLFDAKRNPSTSVARIVGRLTPTNWRSETT